MRASTIGQVGQSSEYDNFHSANKHDLWSKPEKPRTIRKQKVGTVSRETIIHAKTAIQQAVQSDLIEFPIINNLRELEEIISTQDVIPAICSMYSHPLMGKHLQNVATPMMLVHEVLSKLKMKKHAKILCMFNVEWVAYLVKVLKYDVNNIYFLDDGVDIKDGTGKIVSIKSWVLVNTLGIPVENLIYHTELEVKKMKFDYIVGNPPYAGKAALHQQFFVKAFNLINETGTVAFIQPATPYFNKKNVRKKAADLEMVKIVKDYAQSVQFCDENVFEGADVGTKLAITIANKTHNNGRINVQYMNGTKTISNLEGINQLQILPDLFSSIREKFEKLCATNGSFLSVTKTDHSTKAFLSKVRGHTNGNPDFYTLVPGKDYRDQNYTCKNHDFGIPLRSEQFMINFYDYCETFFARFALAMLKMNPNSHMGEMALIPLVDFSRTYTEDELFDMAGFTTEERDIIMNTLPDYHGRRK